MKKNIISALLILVAAETAFAGSTCNAEFVNDTHVMKKASNAAIKLKTLLDKNDKNDVFYIARVGSDSSKYGVKYTHSAFVLRDDTDDNSYQVVHLLNECGTDNSSVYAQGLMNFYLDSLHSMNTIVVVPTLDLQKRLKQVISSREALKMHNPHYNMIAYPFNVQYQNSNQWVVETTAMALNSNVTNRYEAQKFLKVAGLTPQHIKVSASEKLGTIFKAHIVFSDHPKDEQKKNEFSVTTGDTVVNFLKKQGKVDKVFEF